MKTRLKTTWLALAAGAAAVSAQAATYTGDLLIGFTAQSGTDVIYDLGAASSLSDGQTWNLGSLLSGFNLNTVDWGVIGDKTGTPRIAWTTTDGTVIPGTLSGSTAWSTLDTPTKSIYGNFLAAGAGNFITIAATDDNSWNQQTINGALTTQYHNAYENPNVMGLTSDSLYSIAANGSAPGLVGNFSLGADGVVTFSAVPEPSTGSLLAGAGLLAAIFRKRFGSRA